MANENRVPGDHSDQSSEGVSQGSEASGSGPAPRGDDPLTVEDILGAEQAEHVADADATAGPDSSEGRSGADGEDQGAATAAPVDPLEDTANPYLDDLRRITAEYANYRKRTEANALIEKQRAQAAAITPLLAVLDDLDRAEAHGDLEEGSAFLAIAQKIRGTLERAGLTGFGEQGEAFDPQVHEAIAQVPVTGTEEPTVLDVIERGYRIGDVELRPAKVAVAVAADG